MKDYIEEAIPQAYVNIENMKELTASLCKYLGNRKRKTLWLIASGSSYNACYCARTFMLTYLPCDIKIMTPYTFTYYENKLHQDDIAIVVTQSGLSTNAIAALQKVKSLGFDAICLTGNKDSDVKNFADLVIDYGVGEELVGYVTKGVTTLCLYLELFTIAYTLQFHLVEKLNQAVHLNEEMMKKATEFINLHYKNFSSMDKVYVCGAGNTMGVAMEGALKIGETIHIPSVCYEVEEFIHGPNLQLTPAYNVIFFDDNGDASDRVVQIYQATRKVSERVYLVSNHPSLHDDDHVLSLQGTTIGECYAFAYLPFVQLLSYHISKDLNSVKQHPLLRKFKKVVDAKTENFTNYDEDD